MNAMTESRLTGCGMCRERADLFPFTMAFQPVVDVRDGRIHAHEALVRGPAGESAASVLAQVTDLNRYAFDQACRVKAIEMAASLGMTARLNINFLPNAVYDPKACIQLTLKAAARSGHPMDRITFEIIESEQIVDDDHLCRIIAEYKRHGFSVALDDFGTGYSGLARLARLQPDIIKLDRVLIDGCDRHALKREILAAMAGLCRSAGVQLVAEGIETAGELEAVRAAGIDFVQGFFFAKPAFERLVQTAELPSR